MKLTENHLIKTNSQTTNSIPQKSDFPQLPKTHKTFAWTRPLTNQKQEATNDTSTSELLKDLLNILQVVNIRELLKKLANLFIQLKMTPNVIDKSIIIWNFVSTILDKILPTESTEQKQQP